MLVGQSVSIYLVHSTRARTRTTPSPRTKSMSQLRFTVCKRGKARVSDASKGVQHSVAHPHYTLIGLLVCVDDVNGLLDFAQDHVHVAIVGL